MRIFIIAGLLAASAGAQAQNDLEEVMVMSKMTGACGIVKQLLSFQEATKMPGGEEFVMRFLATEAARLGWTPLEFVGRHCKNATEMYVEFAAAVKDEPNPTSGTSSTAPQARPARSP